MCVCVGDKESSNNKKFLDKFNPNPENANLPEILATVLCPGFCNNLEKFSKIREMGNFWYYN